MIFNHTDMHLLVLGYSAATGNNPMHLLGILYMEINRHLMQPMQKLLARVFQVGKKYRAGIRKSVVQAHHGRTATPAAMLPPGLEQADFELPAQHDAGRANPPVSQGTLDFRYPIIEADEQNRCCQFVCSEAMD